MKTKLSFFFGIIIWLLSASSCGDKQESLPYVYVNVTLSFTDLATIGVAQYKIFPDAGVNGIILYRKSDVEFQAFDLTCMYRPRSEGCKTAVDSTGFLVQCPCCKSVFNLFNDGLPQGGPARQPLHQYSVYYTGSFLQISN